MNEKNALKNQDSMGNILYIGKQGKLSEEQIVSRDEQYNQQRNGKGKGQ